MTKYSSHKNNLSDLELVNCFKETGEKSYVGELFIRYEHLVYGVCMKYLADEDESKDVQMQVFEKLFKDLHRHDIIQFKAWLYTVSKNECLMFIRSRKNKRARESEIYKEISISMESDLPMHQEGITEIEYQLRTMESKLIELDEKQRRCLELFYLELKCYKEVVTLTGFSLNEVKSYIQNGKRNLKILMMNRKNV